MSYHREANSLVIKHLEHCGVSADAIQQLHESLHLLQREDLQREDDSQLCKIFRSAKEGGLLSSVPESGTVDKASIADELHVLVLQHLLQAGASEDTLEGLRIKLHEWKVKATESSELCRVFRYAKCGEVQVEISGLSGHICMLNTAITATVFELKRAIEELSSVPPIQQRLIHEGIELEDWSPLLAYKISPWSASITLVQVVGIKVYAVGGFGAAGQSFATAEVFDPRIGSWAPLPDMVVPRNMLAAVVLSGRLWALGGFYAVGGGSLASVEMFDPCLVKWTSLPDMVLPRGGLGAAVMHKQIYAVGGTQKPHEGLSKAEVFDPVVSTWTLLPDMAARRSRLALASGDSKLYAVGGFDHVSGLALESAEAFDPFIGTWTSLPDMSFSRGMLAAVVVDGKLFAIGGYDPPGSLGSVEVFDPLINTWATLPGMPSRRAGLAAAAVDSKIYVFGGGQALASGMCFDPMLSCWTPLPSMASGRAGLAVAAG